jgi:hypothetical protein
MELALQIIGAVAIVVTGVFVTVTVERRRPAIMEWIAVPILLVAAAIIVVGMVIGQSLLVWLAGGAALVAIVLGLQAWGARRKRKHVELRK